MKKNASLRLAKATLTCVFFVTLFTACTKEDEALPLTQIAVQTNDLRTERGQSLDLDARNIYTQTYNNEESKVASPTAGEISPGNGKLISKRPIDQCPIVKTSGRHQTSEKTSVR